MTARRILVYGVTGTGKSTLAAKIGKATGIEVTYVDELTFEPGWVEVEADEQRRRIEAVCIQQSWILDSAYGKWLDIPLARADLVVGLDYPRWLSLGWLLRRSIKRAIDQSPVCNGNIETWQAMFSKKSIVLWHFLSYKRKRRRIREWERDPMIPVLVLKGPKQAQAWLASLPESIEFAVKLR